jgi:biotin transport system substrate-specific component
VTDQAVPLVNFFDFHLIDEPSNLLFNALKEFVLEGMSMLQANRLVLIDALLDKGHSQFRTLFLVLAGSLLLTVSAKVQVPFYPVPMTLQTLVVLLIGVAFGWRMGFATVLAYLAQGAMGLPVFAGTPEKGLGLLYMAGPTGGYLVGFALAAATTGWLAERGLDRSAIGTAIAMVAGNIVIYACGLVWLSTFVGMEKAVTFGMAPFLFGDLVKIALATVTLPMIWKFLNRHQL